MTKAFSLMGVVLVLGLCLVYGSPAEGTMPRIVGGYTAISASMSGMWVAKEANLFEKYGIDVSIVYLAASTKMTAAMMGGSIHIAAMGATGILMANLQGADLLLIASTVNKSPFVMMVQPNIKTPTDLKGKVIGMTRRGSSGDFSARAALRIWGMDPERDVKHIQTGGLPETLAAMKIGMIDAAPMTHPTATLARKAGLHELIDLADLPIEYGHTSIGASRRFLEEHEREAKAFLKAYVEGLYYFRANRDFGMKTIGKYARTGDQDVLAEAYERYAHKYMQIPPKLHPRTIKAMLEQLSVTFPEARTANPQRFFQAQFMEDLEKDGFLQTLEKSYRR